MIIGIIGKMGSGKDTLAKMIQEIQPEYGWEVKQFSGKLKQVASILTGIDVERFNDQQFKSQQMDESWNGMTYREFLQRLGTDAIRNVLHNNVWINALMSDYKPYNHPIESGSGIFVNRFPNWIISDVRFSNEAETIRRMGYPLVKITRGSSLDSHSSETNMDLYGRHHYEIDNNGSISDLRDQVKSLLSRLSSTINKAD